MQRAADAPGGQRLQLRERLGVLRATRAANGTERRLRQGGACASAETAIAWPMRTLVMVRWRTLGRAAAARQPAGVMPRHQPKFRRVSACKLERSARPSQLQHHHNHTRGQRARHVSDGGRGAACAELPICCRRGQWAAARQAQSSRGERSHVSMFLSSVRDSRPSRRWQWRRPASLTAAQLVRLSTCVAHTRSRGMVGFRFGGKRVVSVKGESERDTARAAPRPSRHGLRPATTSTTTSLSTHSPNPSDAHTHAQ